MENLFSSAGGYCDETSLALVGKGLLTEEILPVWRSIASSLPSSGIGSLAAKDSLDAEIDLVTATLDVSPDEVTVRINKVQVQGLHHYFFSSRLASLLFDNRYLSGLRIVRIAESFPAFETLSCSFQPWINKSENAELQRDFNVDTRKYVRDLTGENRVPTNVGAFILQGEAERSATFDAWAKVARERLAFTLVNEVWTDNNSVMVSIVGPRVKKTPLGKLDSDELVMFDVLHRAAEWVYSNPREVEVRHTLFTNELAREWPDGVSFYSEAAARIPRALDSAITAYRAHIRESGKDTIKALSELRKTLAEEISKVSAQTRELIGMLWKDFAIAATALLSRVALIFADKKVAADSPAMKVVLLGTAVFLLTNLYITIRSNQRFMKISDASRNAWKNKLYGFLPEEDLQVLAEKPLSDSRAAYKKARSIVIGIYVAVFSLMVGTSFPWLVLSIREMAERLLHYVHSFIADSL